MTGLLRKAMLFGCAGVVIASSAMASVPDPTKSTIPSGIILVGQKTGVADPKGNFTVTVKDLAGNTIAGSSVIVDFTGCATDSRICSAQSFAGVTADCSSNPGTVSAVTNASGVATLRVLGGGRNTASGSPGAGFHCATIYADGVNLGNTTVAIADENGSGTNNGTAVSVLDASLALSDSLHNLAVGRSDFNFSNNVSIVDVSILLGISLGGGSATGCATTFCH